MLGKGEKRLVAAYSAAHFAVDLCCAMLVLPAARAASDKAMALLIYNFCAFAMQLPNRGAGGQVWRRQIFFRHRLPYGGPGRAAALTHAHRRRMRAGQRGLPYRRRGGRNGGDGGGKIPWHIRFTRGNGHIPRRAGLAGGAELCRFRRLPHARLRGGDHDRAVETGAGPGSPELPRGREQWLRLMSLLAVVALRSYGGVIMSFPWKTGAWAWIAALCVVGGKCIGGFASDRFGEVRSATVTLSAAAIALIFSAFPLPGALGLLLFNMSMPVTLYAARDILREGRATAFGLLTLGLFLGMLPAFSGASGSGQDYAMICLISIMLIRVGVGKR